MFLLFLRNRSLPTSFGIDQLTAMKFQKRPLVLISALYISSTFCSFADLKTRNLFLIITDGFRWQEVFNGADPALMADKGGVKNTNELRQVFWRDNPRERREALLPFFWSHIGKEGQLWGNQSLGSVVKVSNGQNFSYPGYNEIITGIADPRVDSNAKKPNPNINVFEWLNTRPGFRGKVAVLGTWDVFPYIFNIQRSGLPIWPGWEPAFSRSEIAVPKYLTDLMNDATPLWHDLIQDTFLFQAASDFAKEKKPRLLFIGFGETDEWAHAGRYDLYLHAAHHVDRFIKELWETAQSIPQYHNKTTFIITADHGRGSGLEDWKGHGAEVAGSAGDWLAVIGPDTPALGECRSSSCVHAQIAGTIAALLGEDFKPASPQSGNPVRELFATD